MAPNLPCTWGATLDRVDYSKNNKDIKLEKEKEGVKDEKKNEGELNMTICM